MKQLLILTLIGLLYACGQSPEPLEVSQTTTETASVEQYSAETFFSNESLFGSSLSHDDSKVLVTSDRSGIFNVYAYPVSGDAPTQLTTSTTNAIRGVSWFPEDDRFIYTSDNGGDELNHLFVQTTDGTATDITPGENLKAMFYGWDVDNSSFYVVTNERDAKAFDMYKYSVEDYSRTMIFENTSALSLADISPNGEYLTVAESISNDETKLFLIALADPELSMVELSDKENKADYSVFTFSRDSKNIYYGTDVGGEFATAWRYDIEAKSKEEVLADDWDVSFLYFSKNGKYRISGVNADAKTEITIVDTTDGSIVSIPNLPAGIVSGISFFDSEMGLVFYVNSDVSPSNLYSYTFGGEVKKLTDTLNPAIDSQNLVASEVVRFPSFDDLQIPALQYKPIQATVDNPVPALILIHGGPGGQSRMGYSGMVQHLVNHGYAILAVNNRGSSGYGKTFYHLDDKRHGEDDLQDIVYAKKYLMGLDWVDDSKIVVMGGSYGGYLTMAAMAFTDEFTAGINIFGVTNWVRTLKSIPPWWEAFKNYLYDELGNPETDEERLYRISPLFHADKIKKPVLIVQGANDPRVLQVESDEMVASIKANNVPVEYVLFPDEGHGFRNKQNRITAQEAYLSFLKTYVDKTD